MQGIWNNNGSIYKHKTIRQLTFQMHKLYDDLWWKKINQEDSKLRTFKLFKTNIILENYLLAIHDTSKRQEFSKLRISAHQLRIELGRYSVPRKTPLESRTCQLCKTNSIENEIHFVIECPIYQTERKALFDCLNSFTQFSTLSRDDKFIFLMTYNNGDTEVLKPLLKFVNECVEKRKEIMCTL